ncbi:MAG: sulfatase-like hydrolase/transferase [bacterium]|nr:sulfatase-like hydrolase/transferase [bacterium]
MAGLFFLEEIVVIPPSRKTTIPHPLLGKERSTPGGGSTGRSRAFLPLMLVLWLSGAMGCEREPEGSRPVSVAAKVPSAPMNLLLISIDTLRADHLGCYGYFRDTSPNIDAFSRGAVCFENAYAPIATTLPAHVSLFTGLDPLEHGITANIDHGHRQFGWKGGVVSITEVMRRNGYTTAGFVSAAPLRRASGFAVGFDTFVQPTERAFCQGGVTNQAALAWLETQRAEPFFMFVHYFDPHGRYEPPPPYDTMFDTTADVEEYLTARRFPDSLPPSPCAGRKVKETRRQLNLYDGEIRYTDELVGRLLASVRRLDLWDRTVIVIFGDHGQGLNQHDWPAHGRTWNEQLRVPLLMHLPGAAEVAGERVAELVSLVDVVPTVLGRWAPDWAEPFIRQASGRDVFASGFAGDSLLGQRSSRKCGDDVVPQFALTTELWRYHWVSETEEWLFDRKADPYELNNLSAALPQITAELRSQTWRQVGELRARAAQMGESAPPPGKILDPETIRQLEALGYVGGDGGGGGGGGGEDEPSEENPVSPTPADEGN